MVVVRLGLAAVEVVVVDVRQENVKVELGLRVVWVVVVVEGGSEAGRGALSGEVELGPVALGQGGQAEGLRGSHVLSWYRQMDADSEKRHRRQGEAGRRRCCCLVLL